MDFFSFIYELPERMLSNTLAIQGQSIWNPGPEGTESQVWHLQLFLEGPGKAKCQLVWSMNQVWTTVGGPLRKG